jgi:hypothetical protein
MFTNAHVTEPIAVPDVFISGLHSIEDIGGRCVRYTCYVNQTSVHDGTPERVICLRIVVPREAVIRNLLEAARFVGFRVVGVLPGEG